MKKDIKELDDIKKLVNSFYAKVRADRLIGHFFIERITDWKAHLEKMYRFWQTLLLDTHTYHSAPFPPHAKMPIQQDDFKRWVQLWEETVDEYFTGDIAEEAKWRGNKMATIFFSKIDYYRSQDIQPLD